MKKLLNIFLGLLFFAFGFYGCQLNATRPATIRAEIESPITDVPIHHDIFDKNNNTLTIKGSLVPNQIFEWNDENYDSQYDEHNPNYSKNCRWEVINTFIGIDYEFKSYNFSYFINASLSPASHAVLPSVFAGFGYDFSNKEENSTFKCELGFGFQTINEKIKYVSWEFLNIIVSEEKSFTFLPQTYFSLILNSKNNNKRVNYFGNIGFISQSLYLKERVNNILFVISGKAGIIARMTQASNLILGLKYDCILGENDLRTQHLFSPLIQIQF